MIWLYIYIYIHEGGGYCWLRYCCLEIARMYIYIYILLLSLLSESLLSLLALAYTVLYYIRTWTYIYIYVYIVFEISELDEGFRSDHPPLPNTGSRHLGNHGGFKNYELCLHGLMTYQFVKMTLNIRISRYRCNPIIKRGIICQFVWSYHFTM